MAEAGVGDKHSQQLTREELQKALAVARGDSEADILIKNIKVLDLVNGDIVDSAIAISGRTIAGVDKEYEKIDAIKVIDGEGMTAVPGFIDSHLHIESSLMHPFEFEKVTLPLGTTTAVCDPHEITNVLGESGFTWFLRCSELMQQNLFVQVSSCIPALPGFETNNGEFVLSKMQKHVDHSHVLGLGEMMNFPAVINGNDEILDKLQTFAGMNIDGHCPLLTGKELNAYIIPGIQNCHETMQLDEAEEKLRKGMALMIREGTVAKNLKALAPVINEFNSPQCMLCTDDRNPAEIMKEGHIDHLIRMLINECKVPIHIAYRIASYSSAKHFGLHRLGLIAPGKQADIVLIKDLKNVEIGQVYIKGHEVESLDLASQVEDKLEASVPPKENTIARQPTTPEEFNYDLSKGVYNVIKIIPDALITEHLQVPYNGTEFEEEDILKLAVVERYGENLRPALGLVKGFGLKSGAIASTVAHDSHNIIAMGTSEEEISLAVNALIEKGGGLCVVEKKKLKAILPLPLGGLMSTESSEAIADKIEDLRKAFKSQGVVLEEPFLQMAFLALPVIPNLKITDKGLVDVTRFKFIPLRVDSNGNGNGNGKGNGKTA